MTIYQSPGVFLQEIDLSQRVDGAATSTGAIVFESNQGPLEPTLITGGRSQFLSLYGNPDPSISFGHDTAMAFLTQSGALYCRRVVNNALYAGTIFYQEKETNPTRTLTASFPVGLTDSFLSGNHTVNVLNFQDKTVTANVLSVDITNGVTTQTATTTFAANSNTTLTNFATDIQTKLNMFSTGNSASVVVEAPGLPIKQQVSITFSADFVSLNNIALNVVINGVSTAITPVVFTTNQLTTMQTLAARIITAGAGNAFIQTGSNNRTLIVEATAGGINTTSITGIVVTLGASQPTGTTATVRQGTGVNDNRLITVIISQAANVILQNLIISGGASQPATSIEENVELFEIFSQNPGAWGNNIGAQITVIDTGIAQNQTITLSQAFVTGNTVTGLINNVAITPVAFATDSDTTLAALATTIDTYLKANYDGNGSASVVTIPNSTSDDRTILVVSPDSVTEITFDSFSVGGGASQPILTIVETLSNVPTSNTFSLAIFNRDNVLSPLEKYTVSLGMQTDGFGNQENIAEQINNSASRSAYVRIAQTSSALTNVAIKQVTPTVVFLAGGDNGLASSGAQIKQGWADFTDKEKYDVRILLNAGYYDPSVQQYITSLAASRQDCIAILDMPPQYQELNASITYRKSVLNINSSYGTIYSPDLLIVDEFTNVKRYVPPSGYVGAQYAFTDTVAETWFSPAGLNRGNISNVVGLRYLYKKGDLDISYPSQINSIVQKSGIGFVIWGDKTLQAKSSSLSFVSVRRLLAIIGVSITRALDFSVFEPNDDFTRTQIVNLITGFLRPIQDKRGLQAFEVVSDSRNNKPSDIDAGILNVDVYLTPTIPTQFIAVRLIVTKTGVTAADLTA